LQWDDPDEAANSDFGPRSHASLQNGEGLRDPRGGERQLPVDHVEDFVKVVVVGCRLMAVEEILSELRELGEPQRVAALKRSGISSPAFGVGLPELRSLAKRIGHDHELALALWQTTVREPRILASLIDQPDRVTTSQMDRWAETFDSWEICDQCCQNLLGHATFALDKAVEWAQRPEEFVKRAAYVLVAVRAVHDKSTDDQTFADLLPTLIAAADDERVYVRKGASWALRQLGKRSDRLRARVLAAVIPRVDDSGRGIRWVARDVSRELLSAQQP
jgi:3-methyladenine DNA glycosylase AlkD